MSWTVDTGVDNIPPKWITIPKEKSKSYIHAGCGPEINVNFQYQITEKSEYLFKATVKNISKGTTTVYCVPSREGLIKIGQNMCFGAFRLVNGKNFEVRFSVIDASGNETPLTGPSIKFSAPSE